MKAPRFLLYVIAVLLTPPPAQAALTEAATIERGMAQPRVRALLEARVEQAEGERRTAGRWENPEVEYSQENLDLPSGRSEETIWWLRQRLPLSGSKGLERDAAGMELEAARARVDLERRQWRARIRTQFHDALAARIRVEHLADHHRRLQRVATMIEQRVARGDAARYDSLRMGQELARARGALAEARARQQAERAQLFALIGGDPETLDGALLPPAAERGDPDLEQHPQLQMLTALEQSASLSARAARRAAWPEVSLGIGRKSLDEDDLSADGSTVALSLEIPLFDRSQGEAGRAQGRVHEYVADHALTRTRLRAQRSALQTTLAAQRESARGLRQVMTRGEGSLGDLAESSYEAGELGVMELLDAWRTELETRLQYLDTARAARATLIQLQNLEGQ